MKTTRTSTTAAQPDDSTLRSEVEDFLSAITSESQRFQHELTLLDRTNSTIFEKMSSLEDGLQYQYQEFAKFRLDFDKTPRTVEIPKEDVDMSMIHYEDSSEVAPGTTYQVYYQMIIIY